MSIEITSVFVPTPPSLTTKENTVLQSGRKRKRNSDDGIESSRPKFTANGLGQYQKHGTLTFTTITTIPKAHMPLAWLDCHHVNALPPPGFIFESPIQYHENSHGQIIISRLLPNAGIYAIERVGPNTYISFGLHNWVTEEMCQDAAERNMSIVDVQRLLHSQEEAETKLRRSLSISSTNAPARVPVISPRKPTNRRGALARMSILSHKEIVTQTIDTSIQTGHSNVFETESTKDKDELLREFNQLSKSASILTGAQNDDSVDAPKQVELNQPPRVETDIQTKPDPMTLDQFRQQYLTNLYLSKTSLAFFAKGPLSRARSQAMVDDSELNLEDLIDFYSQSVLPAKKMDVKYKESLSKLIDQLPSADIDDLEESSKDKVKKRKVSKKQKLGKDCLWPSEPDFVKQWWKGREIHDGPGNTTYSRSEDIRRNVSDLRMRETEMQLLLLLEIVLLEASANHRKVNEISQQHPIIKTENIEEDASVVIAKTPKAKKPRNFQVEIDALVDRLCIWHEVGFDDMLTSLDTVKDGSTDLKRKSKDRLKDFCADAIIPYYASKLPEQCKSICRKLGGPEISPQRPKPKPARKSISTKPISAGSKQKSRSVEKRSLERILSEDQFMRHSTPPALSRSSTAPLGLNREPSEQPTRPISRGGLHKSVSFTNREVDLVADAKAQTVKRRKLEILSKQKQDLDAAIAALRKPNRIGASGAFMDDIERRSIDKMTGLKRTDQLVQISATPKKFRSKRTDYEEPELPPMPNISILDENPVIPSSTMKGRDSNQNQHAPRSSAMKRAVLSAIYDTPSRSQSKMSKSIFIASPSRQSSSQLDIDEMRPPVIAATPAKYDSRLNLPDLTPLRMTKSQRPVLFTPLKRDQIRVEDIFRDAPEIPELAGKAMDRVMGSKGAGDELSIYDRLGWNDDFDL